MGPDARHPFLIQKLQVWDSHWALSPAGPGVLVDGLDVAECTYGLLARSLRGSSLSGAGFLPDPAAGGSRHRAAPDERVYPAPLNPVDDRPPVTVMTSIKRSEEGRVVVRGVTADDGTVQSVRVNGREARRLAPNFLEWEAVVEEPSRPYTDAHRQRSRRGRKCRTRPPSGRGQESLNRAANRSFSFAGTGAGEYQVSKIVVICCKTAEMILRFRSRLFVSKVN